MTTPVERLALAHQIRTYIRTTDFGTLSRVYCEATTRSDYQTNTYSGTSHNYSKDSGAGLAKVVAHLNKLFKGAHQYSVQDCQALTLDGKMTIMVTCGEDEDAQLAAKVNDFQASVKFVFNKEGSTITHLDITEFLTDHAND